MQDSNSISARCPRCGSDHVLPIEYGLPSEAMIEDSAAGRISLGGCIVTNESPDHVCDRCGYEWRCPGPVP